MMTGNIQKHYIKLLLFPVNGPNLTLDGTVTVLFWAFGQNF